MSLVAKLRGFRNLGNTCYMNAVLQSLLSSNILNSAIILYLSKAEDAVNKISPLLIEYCKIITELCKKEAISAYISPTYSPDMFKRVLGREDSRFRGNDQQDANELMQYVLNEFADEKKDKGMANIISQLCFGKYKQFICCEECKHVEERYERFLDVILPIPDTKNPNLVDCFTKFAKYEKMDGVNRWHCPTCKKKVVSYKKMQIEEVPDVAIFTFNRFKGPVKNNVPIEIFETIELEGKKLKLIATVNHYGSVRGGHYIAYIARGDRWFCANDTTIQGAKLDTILNNQTVYMTFYQTVQ